jgi:DNA-binding LacI/PurR family transcriptional regulator
VSKKRRPTQADIAKAAGVSPAVVSLVINGRTDGKIRISEVTQERVLAAIREYGYAPNLAARQLAGGRSGLLGVFTYEPVFPMHETNFYYPFLVGIEEQAENLGFNLLLFTGSRNESGQRQIIRDRINTLQAADGAILLGTNEDREELARLVKDQFPFVFVGRREIHGQPVAYVAADYANAAVAMVEHLVHHRHARIMYVRSPVENESAVDRERGYRRGCREHGLPNSENNVCHVEKDGPTPEEIQGWLRTGVTAFIAENMPIANRLRERAASIQLTAPAHFSVAALGNTESPAEALNGVTTLDIPRREMGARSVDLLTAILYAPHSVESRQLTLPCQVIPGMTVGDAPTVPRTKAVSAPFPSRGSNP